jgi:hypothetical protein
VDHALRDALAVEARELLEKVEVLQQHGAGSARSLRVLVVADGDARFGAQDLLFAHVALLVSIVRVRAR